MMFSYIILPMRSCKNNDRGFIRLKQLLGVPANLHIAWAMDGEGDNILWSQILQIPIHLMESTNIWIQESNGIYQNGCPHYECGNHWSSKRTRLPLLIKYSYFAPRMAQNNVYKGRKQYAQHALNRQSEPGVVRAPLFSRNHDKPDCPV